MSNRFATIALTILASIIGASILFVVSLFLFPGVSLFGVKYIALNTHAGTTNKFSIQDRVGNFTGIVLNTYEVPVYVIFSEEYSYEMEYVDNFNGLTSSKIDNPSYKIEKDDMGNAVISISEFHTFIYESNTSQRYIKLYVPLKEVSTDRPGAINLTINSTKSAINFAKAESSDSRIPRLYSVSIKTNGNVSYKDKVLAKTFEYETNNSISIDDTGTRNIVSDNYVLTSNRGNIFVAQDVSGDLTLKTNQGKIAVRKCRNLTAETRYGDIYYNAIEKTDADGNVVPDDGSITVSGLVNINAKSGSVTLGDVTGGNGQNVITTTSGNVKIKKIKEGSVTTQRGSVTIDSVRFFTVKTNSGKVNILEVTGNLDVETARGNINLGSDSKSVKDVKAFSRIGKIYIQSAKGTADIETLSSDIRFINTSEREFACKDLTVVCGGGLYAEGLIGKVKIKCEGDLNLSYSDLSEESTEIELGKNCKKAQINALSNFKDQINYVMIGKQVNIQENQNNTIVTLETKDRYELNVDSPYVFRISGENAVINICFKSQAEG